MSPWTCAELVQQAPQYFDSAQAAGITANIGLILTGPDGGEWTYVIMGGQMEVRHGLAQPLAGTMQMSAVDWVKLHTRELNGAEAFRQGRMILSGDMQILRLLGNLFSHSHER